jgi:hypothetical protein
MMNNNIKFNCANDWWKNKLNSYGRIFLVEKHLPHLLHIQNLNTIDLDNEQIRFIYEQETK